MKLELFLVLLGTIWVAPHVDKRTALGIGSLLLLFASLSGLGVLK